MSRKFDAIAFDLDGTLYSSLRLNVRLLPFLPVHWRLLVAFGKARDIIRREQKQYPSFVLPDFYDYQAQLAAGLLNKPADKVKEEIERLIYRGWEPLFLKIKLFPHVREVLDELKAAGFKLGLLSDFPPNVKLENMGIAAYWDTVLCSEIIGALKPSGRPFSELALALGCPPERILYVGNSYNYDVAGSARAGMKSALLAGRLSPRRSAKPEADFTFRDYRQLRNFVLQ
jgi:putative hydrolase of the HAD superfamily